MAQENQEVTVGNLTNQLSKKSLQDSKQENIENNSQEVNMQNQDVAARKQKAEEYKNKANAFFKDHKYFEAIDEYTKAIQEDDQNAVYYSNRSFAQLKLENYGFAVRDADEAIRINPKYAKGYYRLGDANFALGKIEFAYKGFQQASKLAPKDPDLIKKMKECQKEIRYMKFAESIKVGDQQPVSETIELQDMPVEDNYTGIKMEGNNQDGYKLNLDFVKQMVTEFKAQRTIHKRFAYEIILETQNIFKKVPNLIRVDIPKDQHFTVCGDIHGQYYDLLNIFDKNGLPSEKNPYLFNGDFVDRGSFSSECILVLFAFKVLYPNHMFLSRGNHESKAMNKIYGFEGEVKQKYAEKMVEVFRETFCWLPLAHLLNEKVFIVHGGLFTQDNVTLEDINKVDRVREPPESGIMCEILWSDPQPQLGRAPSKRGVGVAFGPDVTKNFCAKNKVDLVIRSHEVKDDGYEVMHDGYLITVFSAPNYCDQMGNKGAYIKLKGGDLKPNFNTYTDVPHPNVGPMRYANPLMGMFNM